MRIGEVFKTRRKNLIIPEYVAFSQCFTLVQIEEPKTRTRAPRHQAAKVEASDLVRVIATAFARLPPGDFLWAMSPRRLYANVSTSCCSGLVPPLLRLLFVPSIWDRFGLEAQPICCNRLRTLSWSQVQRAVGLG